MRKILYFISGLFFMSVFSSSVSAHVTVKPSEVSVGAWQTFTVSVPVEKDNPTVAVRVVIPQGLESITPNVKPGWKISVKKEADKATEILWTGGVIPAGQRDVFDFSAHVPGSEGDLTWNAYQTYQDGSVVSWDKSAQDGETEGENTGPASHTRVIDDLKPEKKPNEQIANRTNTLAVIALALSALSLSLQLFSRKSA